MGIRIHKNIGFFLNKKDVKKILVKKYDDILDDLSKVDKSFVEKMLEEFEKVVRNNDQIGFNYAKIQLQGILNDKKDISFTDLVKSIYHHDTFKGVMFQTPELNESSTFDGLIDYYENVNNPVYKFKALKQGIYPDNYYVCVKIPDLNQNAIEAFAADNPRKPVLEVGDLLSADKLNYLMMYSKVEGNRSTRIPVWTYPKNEDEKYFHPYVNLITYLVAKVSGILQPDVDWIKFSKHLEPSIVTYWG